MNRFREGRRLPGARRSTTSGGPAVRQWTGLALLLEEGTATAAAPAVAVRRRRPVPEAWSCPAFMADAVAETAKAGGRGRCGTRGGGRGHARAWELVHFSLWEQDARSRRGRLRGAAPVRTRPGPAERAGAGGDPASARSSCDVRPAELGVCDAHDHLFLRSPRLPGAGAGRRPGRAGPSWRAFRAAGGAAVVQWTPYGMGRRAARSCRRCPGRPAYGSFAPPDCTRRCTTSRG